MIGIICFVSVVTGNKGAVGVSLLFNGTSMGFVNCHLTSGSDKALRYSHIFRAVDLKLFQVADHFNRKANCRPHSIPHNSPAFV